MSHTTKISKVPVRDINALQSAVAEIQAKGIRCDLKQGIKPRMYYPDQHGVCDYVLQLQDSRYDVGFTKNEDGSYTPVCDLWAGEVSRHLGASCPLPGTKEGQMQHAIGQLMQNYSKHAAINAAVNAGHSVESCTVNDAGEVELVLATY